MDLCKVEMGKNVFNFSSIILIYVQLGQAKAPSNFSTGDIDLCEAEVGKSLFSFITDYMDLCKAEMGKSKKPF